MYLSKIFWTFSKKNFEILNLNFFFNNRAVNCSKLVRICFVSIFVIETTKKSISRSIFVYVNKCRKWIRRFFAFIIANFVFNLSIIRSFKIFINVSIILIFCKITTKSWILIIDVIFDENKFLKTFLIDIVIFVFDWISKISTMIFFSKKKFVRDSIFWRQINMITK